MITYVAQTAIRPFRNADCPAYHAYADMLDATGAICFYCWGELAVYSLDGKTDAD